MYRYQLKECFNSIQFKKGRCFKLNIRSNMLITTGIIKNSFRVDFESKSNRLGEIDRRNANVVGAKGRLELELVDLGRVGRIGAEETRDEHAGLVQILE